MDKLDSFVSVVTLLGNDPGRVENYLRGMHVHLDARFHDYEIVVIDRDLNDVVIAKLQQLLTVIPSIRYLKLSSSVPEDVALAAGLENAIGDFVVLHAIDTDPVDCIAGLVKLSLEGGDIVIGVAEQKQSPGYRLVRPMIHWLLMQIGYNVPRNASGLRCLSRRAVNAVTRTGRVHHQIYVRINKTGYPRAIFHYELVNPDACRRTLREGIVQGMRLLVFNSTRPLRWISALGIFGSLMAFMISLYSVVVHYFKESVVEGWTTMVLFTAFLFMIVFIILAFLGEYLGRLLDEHGGRDDYTVAVERTSNVMIDETRQNVMRN